MMATECLAEKLDNRIEIARKLGDDELSSLDGLIAARLRSLEAEVRKLREASEWRPISEAKKDGTKYMGWNAPPSVPDGCFIPCVFWDEKNGGWCQWGQTQYGDRVASTWNTNPTHWMPIPAAPCEGGAA